LHFLYGKYSLDNLIDARSISNEMERAIFDLRTAELTIVNASGTFKGVCKRNENSLL